MSCVNIGERKQHLNKNDTAKIILLGIIVVLLLVDVFLSAKSLSSTSAATNAQRYSASVDGGGVLIVDHQEGIAELFGPGMDRPFVFKFVCPDSI
jgi:hypothetical protein